jgi:hypothetical protein
MTDNAPIIYHGGNVLNGNINFYVIFYGTWVQSTQNNIINYINGMTSSNYYNIQKNYFPNNQGGSLIVQQSINDDYSLGKSSLDISSVVDYHVNNKRDMPSDKNGIYVVLTSSDVEVSGFCSSFCGWHENNPYTIFVGDVTVCGGSCGSDPGINKDPIADTVINVLTHEIIETLSNPDLDAWYDENGDENGDKCSWEFGNIMNDPNGGKWNIQSSSGKYFVQMNWDPVSQQCLNVLNETITTTTTTTTTTSTIPTTTSTSTTIPTTTSSSTTITSTTSSSTIIPTTTITSTTSSSTTITSTTTIIIIPTIPTTTTIPSTTTIPDTITNTINFPTTTTTSNYTSTSTDSLNTTTTDSIIETSSVASNGDKIYIYSTIRWMMYIYLIM